MISTDYLDDLESSFQKRLSDIFNLATLPINLLDAISPHLQLIEQDLNKIPANIGTKGKILNQIRAIRNVSRNESFRNQFELFNSQIIVLMVGALEAHLFDVVKAIGDNNPGLFYFGDENNKKKNISFNTDVLADEVSVGEIIRNYFKEVNTDISFQDIQSILRFFETYLRCVLEIDDYKDILIFATAARNLTVHNNLIIDKKFIKQIRKTTYSSHKVEIEGKRELRFKNNGQLFISDIDIKEVKEALLSFVSEINFKIKDIDEL